jgi:GTP cyclohydrolase I
MAVTPSDRRPGTADSIGTKPLEGAVDPGKIESAIRLLLEGIGEDPGREGLRETPARVARMYAELFAGLHQDPGEVLNVVFHEAYDNVVAVRDIPFYSMCEHHLLPFFGHAHIAYRPTRGVITGLSKLARLVERVARRPQLQERMTHTVAETLERRLDAAGVLVYIEAEHLCMAMRGVAKPGSKTVTVSARGVFADDPEERRQAETLLGY